MATNISTDSFLTCVRSSGLIPKDQVEQILGEVGDAGPDEVAAELIRRGHLTRWQADKLLQGRHKSFFLGKYRLLSLLGKGGMSAVYLAEQESLGRTFSVEQRRWLEDIRDHIAGSLRIERADFDNAPFAQRGGLGRLYQLFGAELEPLLEELNEVLVS